VPNNPHDALFRFTFGQPENAAALLRSCLPSAIARRVDWDALTLTQSSFVDASAEWRHSDLVFTTRIDGCEAFIYVLLEHQSSADPRMALRVLGYIVRLWDAFMRENPSQQLLPAVLPVVIYHGDSSWNAPTRLLDLVDLADDAKAAFAGYLPDLRFVLDDLTAAGAQRVRKRPMPAAAMLTALSLLGFPRREALGILRQLAELFAALPQNRAGTDACRLLMILLSSGVGGRTATLKPAFARMALRREHAAAAWPARPRHGSQHLGPYTPPRRAADLPHRTAPPLSAAKRCHWHLPPPATHPRRTQLVARC
jgi:hypothetical protein